MKYGDAHRYVVLFAIYLSDCHYKSLHCDREMMIPLVFNCTHMLLKSFEFLPYLLSMINYAFIRFSLIIIRLHSFEDENK